MAKIRAKEAKIPQIKKKISAFLVGEEGKISKESLLKVGAVLAAIAFGSVAGSKGAAAADTHINNLSVNYAGGTATGTHTHHASHSSHSSHASHGSHGAHNSCSHWRA